MSQIKQSIIIKTYNQEKYIRETLDSLLNQSILPYEIIVGDDCSQDKTYEILKEYKGKYPDIFTIYTNETNLGIYKNSEKAKTFITGNVLNFMGGDDMLSPNCLETIQNAITENRLNVETDKFIIVTNSVDLFPNGNTKINNNYRIRKSDPVKERLRYGIDYRRIGISKSLENTNKEYDHEVGVFADWINDFKEVINAEKFVFVNSKGAIYRREVGITSVLKRSAMRESFVAALKKIEDLFAEHFDGKDQLYIKFLYAKMEYRSNPGVKNLLKSLILYLRNYNNFSMNNPFLKNGSFLLSDHLLKAIKKKLYSN